MNGPEATSALQVALVIIGLLGSGLSGAVLLILQSHRSAQADERQQNNAFREHTRQSIHDLRNEVHPIRTDVAVLKARNDIVGTLREGTDRIIEVLERTR